MKRKIMKIGILGAGAMGGTIGKLWAQSGHTVMFSSRHPDKLKGLTDEVGENASAGTVKDAISFGDVVLLAINYWTLDAALSEMHDFDKVIFDCTNPYEYGDSGKIVRSIEENISGGEVLQRRLPEAKVIKAFSSITPGKMNSKHHKEPLLVIPYTASEESLKEIAIKLISDAGFAPFYHGNLKDSKAVEMFGMYDGRILTLEEAKKMKLSNT